MATWVNFIRTNQGLGLDAKLMGGTAPLRITKAMSGAGKVNPLLLREQTELTITKQVLDLDEKQDTGDPDSFILPVKLSNEALDAGYVMYQLGLFAEDPELGEILYMICQTSTIEGEAIPSESEQPAFTMQWNLKIKVSDAPGVTIQVSNVGMITHEEADQRYVSKYDFEVLKVSDIDCGSWEETPVTFHNASAFAHQNLSLDGNKNDADTVVADSELHLHEMDPNAHQNLNVDGNNN